MSAEADVALERSMLPTEEANDACITAVRPLFHSIYCHISFDDCLHMSVAGTQSLGVGRDNFTYGETALLATAKARSRIVSFYPMLSHSSLNSELIRRCSAWLILRHTPAHAMRAHSLACDASVVVGEAAAVFSVC